MAWLGLRREAMQDQLTEIEAVWWVAGAILASKLIALDSTIELPMDQIGLFSSRMQTPQKHIRVDSDVLCH